MSKKVLIISGSPRKGGNSDLLCDEFMRGAVEAGNEVEKIRVPMMLSSLHCRQDTAISILRTDILTRLALHRVSSTVVFPVRRSG